ncbi:DUF3108 domain-containing protein [Aquabacter sp. CN5-332]|uniref:DUF3108 domain-containing protein n=1 Tax=Aquabacter sp. CN5-332 TaxID=3156608 RepID=UPI0032B451DB
MIAFNATLGRLSRRAAFCAATLAGASAPALADGSLQAKYALSVAGIEVGRATLIVQATDTTFEIAGTGKVSGILRAVSSGKGTAAARGTMEGGKPTPTVFAVNTEADGKVEAVRIGFAGTAVKELEVDPEPKPLPDRIEMTDAHKANVIDPMSGAFVAVPGTGSLLSAAACTKAIPIFDGRQRYDVTLTFLRMEDVKADKGYAGPAVVCRVGYVPVAGHRPTRSTVKYMQANKEMFVWLVPIAGTRLMAPFKVSIATMIGTAVLEATSFETSVREKAVPVSTPKR